MKRHNQLNIKIENDPNGVYDVNPIGSHHHEGDIGFDLYLVDEFIIPNGAKNFKIRLGVACSMEEAIPIVNTETACSRTPIGYMLAPRSSMAKLGLRQSNSIGFIDSGYRGEIILPVDNISGGAVRMISGSRICQLVAMNGWEIKHQFVESLTETDRGVGGFGSTGK